MPAWLRKEDEPLWAKAKEAVLKSHAEDEDGFYAMVTKVFEDMGGVPSKSEASEPVQAAWTDEAREAALATRRRKAMALTKRAYEATKKWETGGKRFDDNDEALNAHEKAAKEHEEIGNKEQAAQHSKAFHKHMSYTREMLQQKGYRGEANMSQETNNSETVKAATATALGRLAGYNAGLQVAHWQADTKGEEHETLGDLYAEMTGLADKFAEVAFGKGGVKDVPVAHGAVTDPTGQGLQCVEELRAGLVQGKDDDLLNVCADMAAALNRARYLLKARTPEEKAELLAKDDFKGASVKARDHVKCREVGVAIKAEKVWRVGEPVTFQWMPGGRHTITASYGRGDKNKPIKLTVLCDEEGAQRVKESFEQIKAESPRRPPFICVEHQAKERAGDPQGFEWRTDPEPGIYCTHKPSALGAGNVNGRIHTSFSPTFDTDADYAQLKEVGGVWEFPDGVRGSASNPARVTRVDAQSVGSLTNWNAFKEILPVAAREPAAVKADEGVCDKHKAKLVDGKCEECAAEEAAEKAKAAEAAKAKARPPLFERLAAKAGSSALDRLEASKPKASVAGSFERLARAREALKDKQPLPETAEQRRERIFSRICRGRTEAAGTRSGT